jgi:Coenzyme PQQ synthesis protein D (PqqD)
MTAVYRRAPGVVFRKVGAESVLVPIRSNVGDLEYVYTLSSVAARVWSMLDGTRPSAEIVQTICEEFEVDAQTAAADVESLLADLAGEALVSQVPGP